MNAFKRNLLIGYGVSILLLVISAVASYTSIRNLLEAQELVNHTNEVIKNLDGITMTVNEGQSGQRGYLISGDEIYLNSYRGANQKALQYLENAKALTNDNEQQQRDAMAVRSLIDERFTVLQSLIDSKNSTGEIQGSQLERGRQIMAKLADAIELMKVREQSLLAERMKETNRFAAFTPLLIVITSLLAVIVTILSFFRVNADFEKRELLQAELEQKNKNITDRIHVIEHITQKLAEGDFSVRVAVSERETLGVLALPFEKMAQSLDKSFSTLADKEWQQKGIADLNEMMIGEKDLTSLTSGVIQFLTEYSKSGAGVFYLAKNDDTLEISSSVNLNRNAARKELRFGEGVAGQSALLRKQVLVQPVEEASLTIDHTAGSLKPKAIIAVPIVYEKRFKGVIELASIHEFTATDQEFLRAAAFNIGLAIHSARDHQRLQELLAETQAQSEELQAQHTELENINAELEAQAEKLQASEEELRVQHEELQQSTQELEERSRLLEEKNELILERNLEIQRKAEELELSTKYKSEFLANMSHELRTPLNSILLLSRLLAENQSNNLSSDQVEYANVIQTSGKGLLSLIDEILDLSKIESGKMELEYKEVPMQEIVGSLRSLFEPVAKDRGVDLLFNTADDVPLTVETDKLRTEQILRNLMSNALKFTKKGSVTLDIQKHERYIHFSVKDTGIGIPLAKQQSIFEAFQQADGSTRRQYGGTGLGLSISRELAKLLGGEIRLQSEEGQGSEFTLVLPLQKTTKTIAPARMPEPLHDGNGMQEKIPVELVSGQEFISETIPASIPDDRESVNENDRSILIVEDDTAFARALLDYARNRGYKGLVAVRGDEGIELAKKFRPIGILLDLQLPVKSGWQVMEELKSHPATKGIPVHIMSSHESRTKVISSGAIDFISKPVAFEKLGEIFRRIEQALRSHPKKVLIVEENSKHAKALAYFLESYNVNAEIKNNISDGVKALNANEADCVILDTGVPAQHSFEILEDIKKNPGLENIPVIVFTGKNLSQFEEAKIKQYADSIVVKTAQSYQRVLDEVSLFLHVVEENKKEVRSRYKRLGELSDVLKGKTVLVADDDVRNIFSLSKSLESYGMNVISAIDGKDALMQLQSNEVDLVLIDMMMPEMDGYESTRQIRDNPKYKNLPVIAVTAKAMAGDREKCIAAGASDYITKPVDLDQLISLLRVWLYE